jgi:hypothetical protein
MATAKDNKPKELKVTDRRIFTPEGDIREEFRDDIKPSDAAAAPPPPPPKPAEKAPEEPSRPERRQPEAASGSVGDRRRTMADKAQNPGTEFTDFVEPLIAQAYMSLGMLRNPYAAKPTIDATAARQMIEILSMLKEKTAGNLTPDEDDFLNTYLGELKLAFVQRTKQI